MSPELGRLVDREELRDLVHAYCHHVDTRDAAAAAGLFTEDAVFVTSTGRNGTSVGRAAIARRLERLLATFTATSHHVSNTRMEFLDADSVRMESYLYAWHRFPSDRPDGFLWARYVDRAVRTPAGWRLRERTLRVVGEVDFPFGWVPYGTDQRSA